MALAQTIALFGACTLLIVLSGVRLSRYGDGIAEKSGLGGTWMGVLVMAAVTSLPELVTGVSSIVVFDVPDIAAGDVIGSCMFNLLILAFLDFRHPEPLSARIHQGHVLSAAFGIVMLGLAALAMLAGARAPSIGWIGIHSLLSVSVWVFHAPDRRPAGWRTSMLGSRGWLHQLSSGSSDARARRPAALRKTASRIVRARHLKVTDPPELGSYPA
ncbi:MAG: hypothetical protein H0W53_18935 [Acidobacteria bacterium]|nr:hypothetical protein [Acidobacteriota bacterium]